MKARPWEARSLWRGSGDNVDKVGWSGGRDGLSGGKVYWTVTVLSTEQDAKQQDKDSVLLRPMSPNSLDKALFSS